MSPQTVPPEAKQAIAVLRALTVSRKCPTSLRELMRDYRSLEGSNINFHKFGFHSLEDLIASSGEFVINKCQGETCISAKPNKESAHISAMVKRQKTSRKKSSTPPFRQPLPSDQAWNKSSYSSNVFQKLPYSPTKKKRSGSQPNRSGTVSSKHPGDSNNNNQSSRNPQREKKTSSSAPILQPQTQQQNAKMSNYAKSGGGQPQPQGQPDLRERLNAKTQAAPKVGGAGNASGLQERLQRSQVQGGQPMAKTEAQPKQAKPVCVEQNNHVPNVNLSNRLQRIANNAIKYGQYPPLNVAISEIPAVELEKQQTPSTPTPRSPVTPERRAAPLGKMSIQDRLRIKPAIQNGNSGAAQRGDSPSHVSYSSVIDKELNKTKEKENENKPIVPPLVFEFNLTLDPMTSLAQYCSVRRYPKPEYKSLKSKFSGLYQCRVLVNDVMYSTYPNEYPAEGLAEVACAVNAIESIKEMEARNKYPVCTDSDIEIAMKIHQELKNHPHGIFCKNIPELFESTFHETLPEHWFSLIESSNQFVLESTAGANVIVYANSETAESSAASTTSETEFIVLDKITLPWKSKYWNLFITYCVSTVEIWARIVGKDYSDQLDSLMNDIDVFMLTEKTRPISITYGQIYLVSMSECWHRVRVEEMDKSAGNCLCFFIDFGDEEWLPMDQLFICEPQFLKLPPQAIPFSLFGLEDFAENPNAKRHLDTMLIGKSLVGEVLTKKELFESTNSNGDDFHSKIQVVLYDTSSNEDVNLNPVLLNQICDDTPPPQLKKSGVTNVCITHVTSSGEIYLQVRNPGLLYVQKLISQLVESKFKQDQHKVTEEDLKKSNLFLIQDATDNSWYRGILAEAEPKVDASTYNIFYVDCGVTKATHIARIFRLDSLSAALSKFPRQAIKAKLHNIPPVSESIVARIKGLLPVEYPAIVKIAVNALVPLLVVYRRFDANQGLFNVNEVIQIEYELENNSVPDLSDGDRNLNSPVLNFRASKTGSQTLSQGMMMTEITANTRGISLKSPITVPTSPLRGDLPKLTSNVFIPESGKFFDVLVTMASNPNNFVVQPYNDGPKLVEMMTDLQDYCSNNDEFIPADMLEEGQAYAALNADGNYHRVTVENIMRSSMIHVHYCDFGDIAVISNDKLKTLPAKFRTLPKQAIAAKLHGVKPKHGDWTLQDCMRFKELTVGQTFVSVVKNIADDPVTLNTKILELALIDVSTDVDVFIHEILIDEGRAVPHSQA